MIVTTHHVSTPNQPIQVAFPLNHMYVSDIEEGREGGNSVEYL